MVRVIVPAMVFMVGVICLTLTPTRRAAADDPGGESALTWTYTETKQLPVKGKVCEVSGPCIKHNECVDYAGTYTGPGNSFNYYSMLLTSQNAVIYRMCTDTANNPEGASCTPQGSVLCADVYLYNGIGCHFVDLIGSGTYPVYAKNGCVLP
jgi:hypothetical protein